MKRLHAPLTLVITLLLLGSALVLPASAREAYSSGQAIAVVNSDSPPGGKGDDNIPILVEGDPDELTGGNLSVASPAKPGAPSRPSLWRSFLDWIQQSAEKLQSSR